MTHPQNIANMNLEPIQSLKPPRGPCSTLNPPSTRKPVITPKAYPDPEVVFGKSPKAQIYIPASQEMWILFFLHCETQTHLQNFEQCVDIRQVCFPSLNLAKDQVLGTYTPQRHTNVLLKSGAC